MPWESNSASDPAISYDQRKYDFNLPINVDKNEETMKIKLPGSYSPLEIPKNVNLECKSALYSVIYNYSDGVLSATRTFIDKTNVIPAADYKEYKDFMNKIINSDMTQILLKGK